MKRAAIVFVITPVLAPASGARHVTEFAKQARQAAGPAIRNTFT